MTQMTLDPWLESAFVPPAARRTFSTQVDRAVAGIEVFDGPVFPDWEDYRRGLFSPVCRLLLSTAAAVDLETGWANWRERFLKRLASGRSSGRLEAKDPAALSTQKLRHEPQVSRPHRGLFLLGGRVAQNRYFSPGCCVYPGVDRATGGGSSAPW